MEKKSNFNKFITLLEKDFCRSLKTMVPIIFIFFIGHIAAACKEVLTMERSIENFLKDKSEQSFFNTRGKFGFYDLYGRDNMDLIIVLSILAVILYTLFLWNREWTGSSKSIYTLLSLPIKKSYIIFSKLFTMIIFIGFNILVQILTLFIDKGIMVWRIDKGFYLDDSVLGVFSTSYSLYWLNLTYKFVWVFIATAISVIFLLSLIVLLFRSFKIKGLVIGGSLLGLYGGIYIWVQSYFNLFWDEVFIFTLIFSLITSILAFKYSKYLLENKVGV